MMNLEWSMLARAHQYLRSRFKVIMFMVSVSRPSDLKAFNSMRAFWCALELVHSRHHAHSERAEH